MGEKLFKGIFCLFLLLIIGCSKDSAEEESKTQEQGQEEETFNYTSSSKYNLNVVYFVPKGSKDRNDSHRRISEILLQGQDFFKQQMIVNGFGEKTFNLFVDNEKSRIKIDYINGQHSASEYPYEGGGTKVMAEVEAYYASNPDKKHGDHFLVLLPVSDIDNANVPYYGLGRWGFAADYDDMDIKHLGSGTGLGTKATTYIGGLLHEMGHGLNLPHNKEKVSDFSNQEKGTALMGSGNYTYGSSPTFLTKASCAILNNNQVFGNSNDNFYTGATGKIENLNANHENGSINISGTIDSDVVVNYVSAYNDPADDDADYDAVTWAAEITNNNFDIAMPINELHKKENTPYVLRLRLNHVTGDITNLSYFYKFENGIPVIGFGEQDYLDRSNWSIESYSSQEDQGGEDNTGRAADILDGDLETYWHSCWTNGCNDGYPHSITINTGGEITAKGFAFIQRYNLSRAVKDIEILVSDDNVTWNSLGNFVLNEVNTAQNILLDSEVSFSYIKIEAKSAYDAQQWASLAEVMCF
ncbi:discoidin domain-containing protein [Flagellimonas sp.]|uniref:discoidin domain-containing protein n=1 Tax=Flagellimonas sp. TaxID=2058762 RepID=UPI003B506482